MYRHLNCFFRFWRQHDGNRLIIVVGQATDGDIHGHYHSAFGLAKRFEEAVKDLNVDGVMWGYLLLLHPVLKESSLRYYVLTVLNSYPDLTIWVIVR